MVRDGTPKELRNIIQKSVEECRPSRTSPQSSSAAIVVRTTIETNGIRRRKGEQVVARCTANVSARNTPDSDRPEERAWSSASTHSSATTPNSEDDQKILKPSDNVTRPNRSSPNASRRRATESLRSQQHAPAVRPRSRTDDPRMQGHRNRMAALESKLQASRDRTMKSEQLFRGIPVPMTEGPPSPSFFYPTDQISPYDETEQRRSLDQPAGNRKQSPSATRAGRAESWYVIRELSFEFCLLARKNIVTNVTF